MRGRPPGDHRRRLDGIFWIAPTAAPGRWAMLVEASNETSGDDSVQMIDADDHDLRGHRRPQTGSRPVSVSAGRVLHHDMVRRLPVQLRDQIGPASRNSRGPLSAALSDPSAAGDIDQHDREAMSARPPSTLGRAHRGVHGMLGRERNDAF
jgi:hypothetical protein